MPYAPDSPARWERDWDRVERAHLVEAMAAGVVHDFRNLTGIALGHLEVLLFRARRGGLTGEEIGTGLEVVRSSLADATRLVDSYHSLLQNAERSAQRQIDLAAMARQVAALVPAYRHGRRHTAPVALKLDLGKVPLVCGDPVQLRCALLNVVANALDAMPDGGALLLRVSSSGECVVVDVRDAGEGMPAEVLAKATDPFFTTKGRAGTGLGLFMTRSIVERHAGTLQFCSAPGEGTAVRLLLPLAAGPPTRSGETSHASHGHASDRYSAPTSAAVSDAISPGTTTAVSSSR